MNLFRKRNAPVIFPIQDGDLSSTSFDSGKTDNKSVTEQKFSEEKKQEAPQIAVIVPRDKHPNDISFTENLFRRTYETITEKNVEIPTVKSTVKLGLTRPTNEKRDRSRWPGWGTRWNNCTVLKSHKLIIILREETSAMQVFPENKTVGEKEKEVLGINSINKLFEKIYMMWKSKQSNLESAYVITINYGKNVRVSQAMPIESFKFGELDKSNITDGECKFYDALVALEEIVNNYYRKTVLINGVEKYFDTCEIHGFGNAIDANSSATREEAMKAYNDAANFKTTVTRYFCIDEEGAFRAACIGFRTIGSVNRSWN